MENPVVADVLAHVRVLILVLVLVLVLVPAPLVLIRTLTRLILIDPAVDDVLALVLVHHVPLTFVALTRILIRIPRLLLLRRDGDLVPDLALALLPHRRLPNPNPLPK